jgi:DNA-directed RNA polymerase subunit beta
VPESFKVLIKELQSLGLDVKVLSEEDQEIEIREEDDDVSETAKELGLDIHGDEEEGDKPRLGRILQGGALAEEDAEDEELDEEDLDLELDVPGNDEQEDYGGSDLDEEDPDEYDY